MKWWPTGGLWRHSDFLKLWAAQLVSAVGSRITRTALPVIAILTIDATPNQVAVLSALSLAPGVVVGLLAGGLVDRSAKRSILIASDLVRAVLVMTIPIAAWTGYLSMWQLYVIAGLVGAAPALFQIADNVFLPVLIGKAHLVEGNAKLEATESVAEITGPGLAGILIQVVTAPVTMVFDALTYLWSAGLLFAICSREEPVATDSDGSSVFRDVAIGFGSAFGHPLLRPLFLVECVSRISFGFFFALYMIFTLETLELSPATVGILISFGGVGALLGAMISTRLGSRLQLGTAMLVFLTLGQAGMLLIPVAAGPEWLILALLTAHQIIGDGFSVAYDIHAVSLRQSVLPISLLGRVNATLQVVTGGCYVVGIGLAGPLATALGVRASVLMGVLVGLAAPLFLWFSPIRRLARMPTSERWERY